MCICTLIYVSMTISVIIHNSSPIAAALQCHRHYYGTPLVPVPLCNPVGARVGS